MGKRSLEAFTLPGQRGVASRAQLLNVGWTYSAIQHALATSWQQPAPGVLLPHRGRPSPDQLLVIGALWAGVGCTLTAGAALAIYGALPLAGYATDSSPSRVLTFVGVGHQHGGRCSIARRRLTRYTPPIGHRRGPLLVAEPARALVDHARYDAATSADLEGLTIACLQQNVTTMDLLDSALSTAGRPHLGPVREGLRIFRDGAWSRPEATLRHLVLAERLPQFVTNHTLVGDQSQVIGTPDAYFPHRGVVVQVHSKAYHQGWDEAGTDLWAQTVQRDNRYAAAGLSVVAVTPTTLAREARPFLRQLTETLRLRDGLKFPGVRVRCPQACAGFHTLESISAHT